MRWPAGTKLVGDSGFTGYTPPGSLFLRPFKKQRGRPRDPFFTQWNRRLAQRRVSVEPVLAGVKRSRIGLDTLRNWRHGFADAVMEVAYGWHNLRELVRRPVAA